MTTTPSPCPVGRHRAAALAAMNVRGVIAPDGLVLVARPSSDLGSHQGWNAVGPKYQVRDEKGRYVAYWVLRLEIDGDMTDLDDPPWGW